MPVVEGHKVKDCLRCDKLCANRRQIVNGWGPQGAAIAYIAEAPGPTEDEKGRPLIGPAGQTVRRWMREAGIDPDRDVYWDNACRCWPPGNRKPTDKEVANCNAFLWAALEHIKPQIVMVAGNTAAAAVLGELADQGITRLRGHVFWNERLGCKVIPTIHPSAVLHNFEDEPSCIFDIKKLVKELRSPKKMPPGLGDYKSCTTVEEVEEVCKRLQQADCLSFDCETDGLNWRKDHILCVSFTDAPGRAWIVPLVGKDYRPIWSANEMRRVLAALKGLLESDVPKIGQNLKFDLHFLKTTLGIEVQEFAFDTMLAYSLINEGGSHALETLRSFFSSMPYYDHDVIEQSENKAHMERVEEEVRDQYAGADADCTMRVAIELDRMLDEEGNARWIFENITMPAQRAAMRLEENGVLVDEKRASEVIRETDRLIREAEVEFYSHLPKGANEEFNYGSTPQLQQLLYVDLKLPMPHILTKTTGSACATCREGNTLHPEHVSTDKEALKELQGTHPIIDSLLILRTLTKLRNSFLLGSEGKQSGLLQAIEEDGRIHTTYRVDGTVTGRSSTSPNLQNIPKDTEDRPEIYEYIRRLFCAPEGYVFMEADYSQIELRILAYLSGEKELIKLLEAGEDQHLWIARHVLYPEIDSDLPDTEWKTKHKDLRDRAKVFNFGLSYGMTDYGVARRWGCSREEARKRIEAYMKRLPGLARYFARARFGMKRDGYRENCFGRRRHFHGIKTMRDYRGFKKVFGHMLRQGYNFPVQSSAADIHSMAMAALSEDAWLAGLGVKMVMSVHDSLAFEVPVTHAEEVARYLQEQMAVIPAKLLKWQLPAEVNWGLRWSEWQFTLDITGTLIEEKKEAA